MTTPPTTAVVNAAIETWRDNTIKTGEIATNTRVYNQIFNSIPTLEANVDAGMTDVSESDASGVLTTTANFANGETTIIGKLDGTTKTYTWQTTLTNVDGNVKIGASAAASLTNLANAIKGTGGVPGTDYAAATVAHPDVTASSTTSAATVTAKVGGAQGNAITTGGTMASATWGAATLTGGSGVDESNANTAIDNWRDSLRGAPLDLDDLAVAQLDAAVPVLKTTLAALFP